MTTNKADKAIKERVDDLVNIYCNYVFGVSRDAGWHAPGQLESIVNASMMKKGGSRAKFLTARTSAGSERQANDSSNAKSLNEICFVRNKHFDFNFAKTLISKLEIKQQMALVSHRYLTYVYKKPATEAEVAKYLEVTEKTVYNRKKSAEKKMIEQVQLIEEVKKIKAA